MAGFFGFFDFTKEGKGVEKGEMPKKRFFTFFDVYFRKFWKIISVNLLFLLTSLPIFILWLTVCYFYPEFSKLSPFIVIPIITFTAGPSLCGLVKVLRNYAREEHSFTFSDYWESFRKNFFMSIIVWYVNLILVMIFTFAISFYYGNLNASMFNIVPLAFAGTAGLILLFMQYNIYVLLCTFKVNLFQLFKNSFIFAIVALKSNFITSLILAFFSVIIFLVFFTVPPVVIFLICFMPATYAFIATFNIYPHVKKYLIDPILDEEKNNDNEDETQEEENETIFNDTVILEERNKK